MSTRCECDYDYQGPEDGYVKTTRYCPEHDTCEGCCEVLGVKVDPDYPKGYPEGMKAMWLCQGCMDYTEVHGA